jgi:hypothetical protein
MRAKEFILDEVFGYGEPPDKTTEKLYNVVTTLGTILGTVAGYKLSPGGFLATTGGMIGGMLAGALSIKGMTRSTMKNVYDDFNQKATELAPLVKPDLDQFRLYMLRSIPKEVWKYSEELMTGFSYGMDTSDADTDVEYGMFSDTVYPGNPESQQYRKIQRLLDVWFNREEAQWLTLVKKYNTTSPMLGEAYARLYGQYVIHDLLDFIATTNEKEMKNFTRVNNPDDWRTSRS